MSGASLSRLKLKEKIMSLKGTKTEQNLKDAFAGESQAKASFKFCSVFVPLRDIFFLLLYLYRYLKSNRRRN